MSFYGYHDENYRGGFHARADSQRMSDSTSAGSWERAIAAANGEGGPNYATAEGHMVFNVNPIDPADRLPERARAKLLGWVEAKTAAHASYLPAADEALEIGLDVVKAKQALEHMIRTSPEIDFNSNPLRDRDGTPQPGIHPAKRDRLDRIAALEKKRDRARASADAREATLSKYGRLVQRCEDFVNATPMSAKIIDTSPKLPKGATVASVRAEINRLEAELSTALTAPLPSSLAKAAAARYVAALAENGSPNVYSLVEQGRPIAWPSSDAGVNWHSTTIFSEAGVVGQPKGRAFAKTHNTPAILAWLFPDQMLAKLHAEIEAVSDDSRALTVEQREARVAQLDAAILEAERVEAVLVDQEGGEHRADIDARALLGVEIVMA